MKAILILGGLMMAAFGTIALMGAGKRPGSPMNNGVPAPPAVNGWAVVELFTSEGCSSCPAADELVARVQKEDKDLPVYILAFHVDYWDRLGWKDVFSSAGYTERQRQYANWLHLESVYTPQIVVNGKKEFVGSQSGLLHSAIEKSLQGPAGSLRLSLDRVNGKDGKLGWTYRVDGKTQQLSLVVALVQRSATTNVKSGENGGHTLSHVQIVRNFETDRLNGKTSGEGHLAVPAGLKEQDLELIAFLQDNNNGEILAATRTN
ncbi:MAG: DUF1223 domain-containing protein [Bacteroidetes bacterium]|nr:DUF1223 domain-containing protein [Bacteroidota bacterium]